MAEKLLFNMNRQLKFRRWNHTEEKWDRDIVDLIPNVIGMVSANYMNYPGKYIWQQFTGLLDKSGKEIYEGDILLYRLSQAEFAESGDSNDISTVVFERGAFKLNTGDYLHELANADLSINEEIIGNIFENPELLSNTQ